MVYALEVQFSSSPPILISKSTLDNNYTILIQYNILI
jgi:hypothetical protein